MIRASPLQIAIDTLSRIEDPLLDADQPARLVPCWMVGDRSAFAANTFIEDLPSRLSSRIQLTTDGHMVYVDAVEASFGSQIDYAMLIKMFGEDANAEKRYSPAQ